MKAKLPKSKSKSYSRGATSSNQNNAFDFTPTQILTNQILKVLKLRLKITNLHIPEERLIELIKDNLSLFDIRYFKVTSLNIFVDDLMKIIQNESIQAEIDKENTKDKAKDKDKEGNGVNQISSSNMSSRTTILSFNRKVYDESNNKQVEEQPKKRISQKTPMKFTLDNKTNTNPYEVEFYLDGETKEMTMLNDCDLEEIEENIIAEIAKTNIESDKDDDI